MQQLFVGYRFLISLGIIWAISWQISDRIANNVFRPAEYFSYFTIQTSILTALVLATSAYMLNKNGLDSDLAIRLRIAATSAIIVVGIVYNLLLRDVPRLPPTSVMCGQ